MKEKKVASLLFTSSFECLENTTCPSIILACDIVQKRWNNFSLIETLGF